MATTEQPYQNARLSPEERVDDLLPRMSIPEKVGQLMQLDGQGHFLEHIRRYGVGSMLHINGDDADAALRASLETRLGIPVLLADDGIHGHSFWPGATIFPTQLALSCSWDTGLLEAVGRATAREMRATGLKWTFSPVVCIARDLRWGRIGETFGEDPLLIGELAVALMRGYQGSGLGDPDGILATAKHFAGYSETLGGRDASEAELSRRKLRSTFLPPFQRMVQGGAMTFMTGYQSIDGVPSTANRWLLTEVLKEEWGFEGILVTDWYNVGHLVKDQRICSDFAEAAALALKAGNDLIMATPEFFEGCQQALDRGLITENELDQVVRRVLLLKFRMGLFENPGYSSPRQIATVVGCRDHRTLALRAARESLVLLRNEVFSGAPLLPLDPEVPRRLAVVGPNADDPLAQLGDWSLGSGQMVASGQRSCHPRSATVTILDGVRSLLPPGWELVAPEAADVVVAVVGDQIDFVGETKSTATLELQRGQKEFLDHLVGLGRPLVGVLVNSKPLVLPPPLASATALIEVFNPGMEGGIALAEALFGYLNPSGKLTVTFPRHVGQQPVFYNAVRGQHGTGYADLAPGPLFPFGFGLGYSRLELGPPHLTPPQISTDGYVEVGLEISNRGDFDAVEVVQVYVEDLVTSATWARRELKAWRRVSVPRGQTLRVALTLHARDLWIIDRDGRRVVEPGEFRVLVGNSSQDSDLKGVLLTVLG